MQRQRAPLGLCHAACQQRPQRVGRGPHGRGHAGRPGGVGRAQAVRTHQRRSARRGASSARGAAATPREEELRVRGACAGEAGCGAAGCGAAAHILGGRRAAARRQRQRRRRQSRRSACRRWRGADAARAAPERPLKRQIGSLLSGSGSGSGSSGGGGGERRGSGRGARRPVSPKRLFGNQHAATEALATAAAAAEAGVP
eukprot:365047-Chlamydomonas_euryale.AAC.2